MRIVERPTVGIGERAAIVAEFTFDEPAEEAPRAVTLRVEGDDTVVTILGELSLRTIVVSCHPATS